MKKLIPLSLSLILFIACSKDEPVDFVSKNDKEIQAYLEHNNLTATKTESGLYYIITEQGEGNHPTANSNVTVAYKGYFIDGTVFDQSDAAGISFNLNQVIDGWTEGIPYFNEGGSGILLIPAHLGYGNSNYYGIPGGSVLIFEINLLSIN